MAPRTLTGLSAPACLPPGPPPYGHPAYGSEPHVSPWGHQPLPQQCHSNVGLQLLTALPSHGPRPAWHSPGLVFPDGAQPEPGLVPRDMPDAQG